MLAPLRDHLRPKDPNSSPILCKTKELYFSRMSAEINPNQPGFEDARWIVSDDVNVEYLLDVFTSVDPDSNDIWKACTDFMRHLQWYKPRQTVLGPKIEALPDNHRSKPACLFRVAALFGRTGNYAEATRLLNHVLKLEREGRSHYRVALTLEKLSNASRILGLHKEAVRQAKEASKIYEQLGNTVGLARSLGQLARSFYDEGELDAAEEVAVRSSNLLPEKGQEYLVCEIQCTLGNIYRSKGQREKAIRHYRVILGIASSLNWHHHLFWTNFSLAELFLAEHMFDDANAHLNQANSHAYNGPYNMGRAAELHARILHRQSRLEEAISEVLRALEIFEKLGTSKYLEECRVLLRAIEQQRTVGPPAMVRVVGVSTWNQCYSLQSLTLLFQRTAHHRGPNHASCRAPRS